MRIDVDQLKGNEGYKLVTGSVVPRPIAFVTTVDAEGRINAAPFSFFNAISGSPPILAVSIGRRGDGSPKDTAANIKATGEFVVNIVDETLAERMNQSATPFPPGVSEVEKVGLKTKPGVHIDVPYLADAPIAMECKQRELLEIEEMYLAIGDVVCFHIRDDLYDNGRIDPVKLNAVGRLAGSTYSSTKDLFEIDRMSLDEWNERYEKK